MDSTQRFSKRADLYRKFRPGYPPEVIDALRGGLHLDPPAAVADVGSGTGILTGMLLDAGYEVFAVEPNREMRAAAEDSLGGCPRFHSVDGTAEATTLPSQSVDCVAAAQAFHWFDSAKARIEFLRILKSPGRVVLLWNDRRTDATPFLREYEALLETLSGDYRRVRSKNISEEAIAAFFRPPGFSRRQFENRQSFDFEGLQGRLLSASYAPLEGEPGHKEMMVRLKNLFDSHQVDNKITIEYQTVMYFGRLRE